MGYYSRKHYALVSPPKDTPQQIADRLRDNRARELAVADREAKYPVITAENFTECARYQEQRILFHFAALAEVVQR